jgi:hypothetical protein
VSAHAPSLEQAHLLGKHRFRLRRPGRGRLVRGGFGSGIVHVLDEQLPHLVGRLVEADGDVGLVGRLEREELGDPGEVGRRVSSIERV